MTIGIDKAVGHDITAFYRPGSETTSPSEPKKPFPVAWLNGYDGLVPYEDYPQLDVRLGIGR